jgi:uncharacterized protein
MSARPKNSGIDAFPAVLPIFPVAGVLLLPNARLPLNIFEPRYIAMTRDAMHGQRLIGMIQPVDPHEERDPAPALYATGCSGRITAFEETDDGRFLITLTGVCRFGITTELPLADSGYRRARVAYDDYAADLKKHSLDNIDLVPLMNALKGCIRSDDVGVDWQVINRMASDSLVTSLAMLLPFAPNEKQALLEAPDTAERARILTALMVMMAATGDGGGAEPRLQ